VIEVVRAGAADRSTVLDLVERLLAEPAPPGEAWERSVRFYETQGFVFTGPKLRLDLPGI
jgi:hypothetical protein